MTSVVNRALPPPNNWQDFESLCFDLYSRTWKTNDAEMHGRRGQPQAGVDVYGHDRVEARLVGVQCKGKEEGYGTKLTEMELWAEVEKAKAFEPSLEVFVVATTAPNDAAIQKLARGISHTHAQEGLFEVRVQGWQTLRQRITDYPDLVTKHFADFAPYDLVAHIDTGIAIVEHEGEQTRAEFARGHDRLASLINERLDAGDPLQTRMGEIVKLIEDGSTRAALRGLERLWSEEAPRTTARNRYKLRANIGIAHFGLGDSAAAVHEFRAAHAEDPDWPNARAILATAELLEGHSATAFDLGKRALADDTTSHQAAAIVIDAAPPQVDIASLEVLIPANLRERFDILLCLSLRARKSSDFASAEAYARRAIDLRPNDLRATSSLAEILLEPIFLIEGIGLTRRIPAEAQPRFDMALELLRRAWKQLSARDDIILHDHVIANLISALDVAGLEAEGEGILDQALRLAPRSPQLLRRYAQKMASASDWPAVSKAIAAIPRCDIQPQDRLVGIKALIHEGELQAALDQAKILHGEFGDSRFGEAAAGLRIEAASKLGHIHEELDATLNALPRSIIVRSVGVGFLDESDPRRTELLRELDQSIEGINDPLDRFHAADALYAVKEFGKAADLYQGLHGVDKDDPSLRRHLTALYFADRRLDARQLFSSLTDGIKALPDYAEIGAAIYERSGLLKESRCILERTLAAQEDLHKRLQWLGLCERLGDTNAAIKWLQTVKPEQQGLPRDLMTLALAIDRHLGDQKCLPIAYRALRGGYGDPQIHLSYTLGLFLTGHVGRGRVETPQEVQLGVAVILSEKDGDRRLTRIIETEPDPQIDHDEVSPDNPLARKLIGLKLGDEIELENFGLEPIRFVVASLQSKFVYAHFRSLGRFETMFPENRALGSVKIDESKGEERFKPIFDSVKRRSEFARQIEELCRSGLPLAMVAKMGGRSGFDLWDFVRHHNNLEFQTAVGVLPEYREAHKALSDCRRAVVDPITLYGLVQLDIAEAVRDTFEDLGVVQTTLDLLREFLRERRDKKGVKQGIMAWDGEHYHMIELSEEAIDHQIAQAEAVLAFAESLTLVPAEADTGIKAEAREIFTDLDAAYLDTVLAAQGDRRLLFSDDRLFRSLAAEAAQVTGTWTQAAAAFAAGAGGISQGSYCEITNALVDAGYFFTVINHRNLLHALKQTEWSIAPRVQALIDSLARATNEPQGVLAVTADLISAAWHEKPGIEAYQAFFAAIFKTFKKTQPQLDINAFVDAAFGRVVSIFQARARGHFRTELLTSTNLTPVERIARKVSDVASSRASRIAQSLAQAVRCAAVLSADSHR
jgi:tetratricopeptide (TPR) repeat protein